MKIKVVVSVVLLILLGVAGFFYLNPSRAVKLVLPDLNEVSYINANLKNDTIHSKIALVVQNKSIFKLTIDSMYIKINSDSLTVVEEEIPIHLEQAVSAIDTVVLPTNISIHRIQHMTQANQKKDSVTLSLNGYLVYNTILGRRKMNVHKEQRLKVPILPKLKIVKVERKKYNIKTGRLQAQVRIAIENNGKNIDLQIRNISYKAQIKKTLHTKGTLEKVIDIKPNSTTYVDLPLDIVLEHPLQTALAVAFDKDQMDYVIEIKYDVHYNKSKNLNLIPIEMQAEGTMELVR